MRTKYRVGDRARVIECAMSDREFSVGTVVEATAVEGNDYDGSMPVLWQRDNGMAAWLHKDEVEPIETAEQFIANCFTAQKFFDTLQEAEDYIKSGSTSGDAFTIAKVVRTGTIELTLKDSQ